MTNQAELMDGRKQLSKGIIVKKDFAQTKEKRQQRRGKQNCTQLLGVLQIFLLACFRSLEKLQNKICTIA